MKIVLRPDVALKLETIINQAHGLEVSGFGFVNFDYKDGTFDVYDVVLVDIRGCGFTKTAVEKIRELMHRPDAAVLKLWWHRHPLGNGIPGPQNWSDTDNHNCRDTPLGGVPELVKWALAIVRTPYGWVGRYDVFDPPALNHLEVEPNYARGIEVELNRVSVLKHPIRSEDAGDYDQLWNADEDIPADELDHSFDEGFDAGFDEGLGAAMFFL